MKTIKIELIDLDNNYGNYGHIVDVRHFKVDENIDIKKVVSKVISDSYDLEECSTDDLFNLLNKEKGFNEVNLDIETYQFNF